MEWSRAGGIVAQRVKERQVAVSIDPDEWTEVCPVHGVQDCGCLCTWCGCFDTVRDPCQCRRAEEADAYDRAMGEVQEAARQAQERGQVLPAGRHVVAEDVTPSQARGAWTCIHCGFRGFWKGGPHCMAVPRASCPECHLQPGEQCDICGIREPRTNGVIASDGSRDAA